MHKAQWAQSEAAPQSGTHLWDTAPAPSPFWRNLQDMTFLQLFNHICLLQLAQEHQCSPDHARGLQHCSEKSDSSPVLGSVVPGAPEHCRKPICAAQSPWFTAQGKAAASASLPALTKDLLKKTPNRSTSRKQDMEGSFFKSDQTGHLLVPVLDWERDK